MLDTLDLEQVAASVAGELAIAQRPLLIYGAGVRGAADYATALRKLLHIPLVVTWGARDLFPDAESFGTHGLKGANLAVQNADYVLAVGTRLDTKATGSPAKSFAPKAKLVMVDIDDGELDKMAKIGRPLYRAVRADATEFLRMLCVEAGYDEELPAEIRMRRLCWLDQVDEWRAKNPIIRPEYHRSGAINPYVLVKKLSEAMQPDDVLVADTGCGLAWLMQAFKFKGQRFVHAFNQTPMGYGLPAAVGAAFATGKRVVLVTGDGGLGVNTTELATIDRHALDVRILLLNNYGHSMCRQSQRMWLGGEYPGTSRDGGLALPDFTAIACAYGLDSQRIMRSGDVDYGLGMLLHEAARPKLVEFVIPEDAEVYPQIKFGEPLAAVGLDEIDDGCIHHVYPTFGKEHVTDKRAECWCHPQVEFVEGGAIIVHEVAQ